MFPTYGVMSVTENRDLSRAAAERSSLLQALTEQSGPRRPSRWGWLRLRSVRLAGPIEQVQS